MWSSGRAALSSGGDLGVTHVGLCTKKGKGKESTTVVSYLSKGLIPLYRGEGSWCSVNTGYIALFKDLKDTSLTIG